MYIKDLDSFRESLEFLEKYRGIEKKFIIDSLKEGIASAYSKTYGLDSEIEVDIDDDFRISIYRVKKIVEKVEDAEREISLEDAKKISEDAALEDEIMLEERERTDASSLSFECRRQGPDGQAGAVLQHQDPGL